MPTKKSSGRKPLNHLETLKITLTPVVGKTKSKTYRAEKFDFGKVVECINELLTK